MSRMNIIRLKECSKSKILWRHNISVNVRKLALNPNKKLVMNHQEQSTAHNS